MKTKQIGVVEVDKFTRHWVQIGTVYQENGPILAVIADRKGWEKRNVTTAQCYDGQVQQYSCRS